MSRPISERSKVSLPHFIVMRRELVEELLDPIFLPHRVNVGDLVIRQGREVEVNLPDQSM